MNYYIDFDNTIFNTTSFHNDLKAILNKNNITEDYINNYYKENGINPIKLVDSIDDDMITYVINEFYKNAKYYVYPDAINFLKNKGNNNYILYTYGNLDYQNKKIDNANIKDYFDEVIITDIDKTKLNIDYNNSIFIEDNPKIIKELLKQGVNKIYRIKRSNNTHSEEVLKDDRIIEIYSMDEIKD